MKVRANLLAGLSALALSSTAAFAGLIPVTSYDMNNGNGATQFTFGPNYFDFSYTNSTTNALDPNASKNGSSQPIPNNAAPHDAPLTGGTGKLTDGVIATQNYSVVSSTNGTISNATSLNGQPSQYVGWKYQDPTITFHLAGGQNVGAISLYVAANNPAIGDLNGLVAAPSAVMLVINNILTAATYSLTKINANTDMITLTGFGAIASASTFALTLERGPLQQDGIDYYNDHVKGYDPAHPNDFSHCIGFCDPDLFADKSNAEFASGFRAEAAGGQVGPLTTAGLEPWIMLSEVQFFSSAVPETSTWVMMIAGFAGLGFMAYRRKAKSALATT